jgi:transposase InsO family protein
LFDLPRSSYYYHAVVGHEQVVRTAIGQVASAFPQGVQYAARAYVALLEQHQVQISMAEIGEAWQNGYAERVLRTIKEEEVDLSEYLDFTDAYTAIAYYIEQIYQYKRIHAALGYLTPVEFETAWQRQSEQVAFPSDGRNQ